MLDLGFMSGSEGSTGSPEPKNNAPCPTCGNKKTPLKIRVGKYAGLTVVITMITEILCTFDIQLVP